MQTLHEIIRSEFPASETDRLADLKQDDQLITRLIYGLRTLKYTSDKEMYAVYQTLCAFIADEHNRVIDRRRISARGQKQTPAQRAAVAKAAQVSAAKRRGQPRSQAVKDKIRATLQTRHTAARALDQATGE